ncbi:MAG: hypothetical protein FGF52_04120 [Candidatus Brockarchaeota archaeon]|nr:hypothetical protein [Candidatus Brockarchaeota archaeon]
MGSGQIARSPFIFPENRLKLARLIKGKGFSVRMHGYEYLVAHGGRFLCLILLQPMEGIIMVKMFKWIEDSHKQVEKIIQLIKSLDSVSKLIVY